MLKCLQRISSVHKPGRINVLFYGVFFYILKKKAAKFHFDISNFALNCAFIFHRFMYINLNYWVL